MRRPQNFAKSSPCFWLALHRTKVRQRFHKILWPSQNIWILNYLSKLKGRNFCGTLPLSICTWFLTFSSLKYRVWLTWIFAGFTKTVKIQEKKTVLETRNVKLENVTNQVQINWGTGFLADCRTKARLFDKVEVLGWNCLYNRTEIDKVWVLSAKRLWIWFYLSNTV